jgi:Fic family protein
MHSGKKIPVLIKAALIHQQFETIHPFLDGNGRTGRLLITLFLYAQGFVCSPFLYLSLFFKRHRKLYYEKLSYVRKTGDWESWVNFFLEGAAVTAADAKKTLLAIQKVFAADDAKVSGLGRQRASVTSVFAIFKRKPLLTIAEITSRTGFSKPTAMSAVNRLIDIGIIENISEKKWRQIFVYSGYTKLLTPDTGR